MTSARNRQDDFERLLETAHRGPMPDRSACADAATIAAYVDNALSEPERAIFERHAADCTRCTEALALLAGLDDAAPAEPEVAPASRWSWWRWLVPVATVVLVVLVWRDLPLHEPDTDVSPTTAPATHGSKTAPAETRSAPDAETPAEPASPGSSTPSAIPQPPALRKQVEPAAPRNAPSNPQLREETKTEPLAATESQRFEGVRDDKESSSAVASPPRAPAAPRAPAPAESDLHAARARDAIANAAASLQVESADAATIYRRVGPATVQRSIDGGRSWADEATPPMPGLRVGSSPAAGVCWLAGAHGAALRRTADGVWHVASLPERLAITAIVADSERSAIATTEDGARWSTSDGGAHWRRM